MAELEQTAFPVVMSALLDDEQVVLGASGGISHIKASGGQTTLDGMFGFQRSVATMAGEMAFLKPAAPTIEAEAAMCGLYMCDYPGCIFSTDRKTAWLSHMRSKHKQKDLAQSCPKTAIPAVQVPGASSSSSSGVFSSLSNLAEVSLGDEKKLSEDNCSVLCSDELI